jgi:hypothetical protein
MRVMWTGGIGDVFIIDAHIPREVKKTINTMFWATPEQHRCIELFNAAFAIQQGVRHDILWNDWKALPYFGPMSQVWDTVSRHSGRYQEVDVLDWSIAVWHPRLAQGAPFYGSSLLYQSLADISKFNLPEKFIFCHTTPANRENSPTRVFSDADWMKVRDISKSRNLPVVVVGHDRTAVPDFVIDLRNKTSICEAFEILKHATMFVGIASCFAVMAAKFHFADEDMVVKVNDAVWNQRQILFTPRKNFEFLRRNAL